MAKIQFSENAWDDYLYWQSQDKKTLKKINRLLEGIARNDKEVIGKAEILKHEGEYSRSVRIDQYNRLVFDVMDGVVRVKQCRGHYDD